MSGLKMSGLEESIKKFVESFGENFPSRTFSILYAPENCFLGLVNNAGTVEIRDNIESFSLEKVYEARIFNAEAELRWLKDSGEIIVTDAVLKKGEAFVDTIDQQYLLWGEISPENNPQTNGEWTELAEARIGKYFVPVKTSSRACFTATEYLKEFKDGNVAVFDERLTGISEVN